MPNHELDEAIEWLREALRVGQKLPLESLNTEQREEWMESMRRKRTLLERLERLNQDLNSAPLVPPLETAVCSEKTLRHA